MIEVQRDEDDRGLTKEESKKKEAIRKRSKDDSLETAAQSMKSSTADGKSIKSTKQRQLNKGSKVLMLKVERGKKMRKEFRLYQESEIFSDA